MPKIQQIAIDCGEPDLPQKIYNACLNKQAFLFVVDGAGFVLRPMVIDGVVAASASLGSTTLGYPWEVSCSYNGDLSAGSSHAVKIEFYVAKGATAYGAGVASITVFKKDSGTFS